MKNLLLCWGLSWFVPALWAADTPAKPSPAADLLVDGSAYLQHWTLPALPADAAVPPGKPPAVIVRLVVEPTGKVSKVRVLRSPDPHLDSAALAAVRGWTFTPALQDSKPVATSLDAQVLFTAGGNGSQGRASPDKAPRIIDSPAQPAQFKRRADADYPDELVPRKLPGLVRFACEVDPAGKLSNLTVIYATHVAFVEPALDAIEKSEVRPARIGDLPKAGQLAGEVVFDAPAAKHREILAANFITGPDGLEPGNIPELLACADPVWPYELQLAGQGGDAKVLFTVSSEGKTEQISVESASQPEFGKALAAAVALWQFGPAMDNGQTVAVPLAVHWTFGAAAGDQSGTADNSADPELIKAAKAHRVPSAAGLDHKIRPIFRLMPLYPANLLTAGRPVGEATLDIIIAQDGRVQLPRVISASQADFGWAAAAAATQWVFDPPTKAGKPVDVHVQVPFRFTPPAQE